MNNSVTLMFLVLVCLFGFSCRYLPYDEDIVLAMGTIEKLSLEATIGPFRINNLCYYPDSDRLSFIPDKDDYSRGFLVRSQTNGNAEFRYITTLVDTTLMITEPIAVNVNLANPYKPNGFAETLTGLPGYLYYIKYDYSTDPTPSPTPAHCVIYYNGTPNLSSNGEKPLISAVSPAVNAMNVNGAFINPRDDRLYMITTDYGLNFVELNCFINSSGNFEGLSTTRTMPYPVNETPILHDFFYLYDSMNARSVISAITDDGIFNRRWETGQTIPGTYGVKNEMLGRILSNGNILGFGNGVITGYNYSGKQLYRFPMGSLHYMYEKKDQLTGVYRMVFSFVAAESDHYSNCDQNYTIYVYSHRTSRVDQLNF